MWKVTWIASLIAIRIALFEEPPVFIWLRARLPTFSSSLAM
jgi:hypothetical protein